MKYESDSAVLRFNRVKSVEIISDEELKSDDSEVTIPLSKPRKRKIMQNAAMSGFILRHDIKIEGEVPNWQRFHVVSSDGVIAFSETGNFMIESMVYLAGAVIREIRTRDQGAIFLQAGDQKMLLRFRNKSDRIAWLRSLKIQSKMQSSNRPVDFTPNKRREIYFIDGSEEFQTKVESAQNMKFESRIPSTPERGIKRKGSFIQNVKTKVRKFSDLVNCFACVTLE